MTRTWEKTMKEIKDHQRSQQHLEVKLRKNLLQPIIYHLTRGECSSLLRTLGIEVNSTCNMRCKMCDIGQEKKNMQFYKNLKVGGELSLTVLTTLVDDVRKFRPHIEINAVEPLLYKDLLKFITYVAENRLGCSVTTNGLLLEHVAYSLVDAGLPELWVSVDGPPPIHDRIRGVPFSFERASMGMRRIMERKEQLGATAPVLGVAYTISNYNYHSLVETAQLFNDLGVDRMVFAHLNFIDSSMAEMHNKDYARFFGEVSPSTVPAADPRKVDIDILTRQVALLKKTYAGFARFIPDIEKRDDLRTYYYEPTIFVKNTRCKIPWRNAQILSNGDVIPAARCFHNVMGNIFETPFTEIWNNEPSREFRRAIREWGATPACSRCCSIFGQ